MIYKIYHTVGFLPVAGYRRDEEYSQPITIGAESEDKARALFEEGNIHHQKITRVEVCSE